MAEPQQKTRIPAFTGRPLRDFPVPAVDYLKDDEFGTAVLSEYQDRVNRDFGANPCLRILKTSGGVVRGCNPFAAVLIDMIVRPHCRVATPVDLQAAYEARVRFDGVPDLRGCYKDAALVLRSAGEPNGYLAQRLNEQVGLKTPLPVVIHLAGLDLVRDPDSPCGLAFKLTQHSSFFTAPVMGSESGHFDNRAVDRRTGLPKKIDGSQRYFYSGQGGLTRLYVGRGGSLDTIWDELENSQPDGRVVLAANQVPPAKQFKYLAYLDAATKYLQKEKN